MNTALKLVHRSSTPTPLRGASVSTTLPQKETRGKFNRSALVFDEACGLSATVQLVFRRILSKLWSDSSRAWHGSYRKLSKLCRVSVGMAHDAIETLAKAGLLICNALGRDKGPVETLTISPSLDALWDLNAQYSELSEEEREEFSSLYPWETIKDLQENLKNYRSKNERYRSKNERSQAQDRSKNERYRSKNERSTPPQGNAEEGSDLPTDVVTDTDTYVDGAAPQNLTNHHDISYVQGYGGNVKIPTLTEEGQAFYVLYCQQAYTVKPSNVTQQVAETYNALGMHIITEKDLGELFDRAKRELQDAKNPTVYLGNLLKALPGWLQAKRPLSPTQEKKGSRSLMNRAQVFRVEYGVNVEGAAQ